jgi:RHH-type proline utilization regulon transcriptional repressor/proline dehydrogenase/delta 1-pyrroline-5-carboxylate dehydrogenase
VVDAIAATGYGLTLGIHSRIEADGASASSARLPTRQRLRQPQHYRRGGRHAAVRWGGSFGHGTRRPVARPISPVSWPEQVVSINTAAAGGNATLIAMGEN